MADTIAIVFPEEPKDITEAVVRKVRVMLATDFLMEATVPKPHVVQVEKPEDWTKEQIDEFTKTVAIFATEQAQILMEDRGD